jgi:HlyD family secretion protein
LAGPLTTTTVAAAFITSFRASGVLEYAAISNCFSEVAAICKIRVAMRLASKFFMRREIDNRVCGAALLVLSVFGSACGHRSNSVSGTIEVDEVHVGPRSGGRVEKIFAWEGDILRAGQPIVQLDASELHARRDLAEAQINTAIHDADSQSAQLEFLRDDARRQQDLLKRKVVSQNDAERAGSSARAQEKNVEAAKMRVTQARAQLADIDAQLAEMQVTAPADSVLEVLSVKVGDVLPANREVATLLLTHHLWVRVYVPEPWLGLIKLGEHVRVRVDSFPGKDFDGVVEQINRQAEFTPRNVQTVADRIKQVFGVKIRLPSDDDHLRAGMAADVYFPNVK